MFFVCMFIEVLKVKDHSVGAIFLPPYESVGNDFITTMRGGLNQKFRGEFLNLSVYNVRFSGGPCANFWRGVVSKSIFIPITVERISLSDVILRQAGKECAMHPVAKVSQRYCR